MTGIPLISDSLALGRGCDCGIKWQLNLVRLDGEINHRACDPAVGGSVELYDSIDASTVVTCGDQSAQTAVSLAILAHGHQHTTDEGWADKPDGPLVESIQAQLSAAPTGDYQGGTCNANDRRVAWRQADGGMKIPVRLRWRIEYKTGLLLDGTDHGTFDLTPANAYTMDLVDVISESPPTDAAASTTADFIMEAIEYL